MTGLMVAGDVVLTEGERRLLARWATREYEQQRYGATQLGDPDERRAALLRWQAIADALHPAPYGPSHRAAELAQRAREAADGGVVIPIRPSLRVRRELTHAPSPVFVALKERIRLDKIRQGWTPERAEWWASRVIANPLLRYRFATVGVDPDEGGVMATFYLTFPNKPGWVTIWAPTYDDARVFAVRNYVDTDWELSWEEDFEPWRYPAGEVNAFAVERVR